MNKIFDGVQGNAPALNRFDLSYTNTLSAKIGLLYPVQCDEVYPGDVFKMDAFCHAEVQPMVAPLMSDLQIYAHTYFVPYRIIYGVDNSDGKSIWEKFITGGEKGDYDTALPAWNPNFDVTTFSSNTIWDCIGNPLSYELGNDSMYHWTPIVPYGLDVSIAPKYAYNEIYNQWYRDEMLVDEVSKDNEFLQKVAFVKDYFTSALENQQKGTSPAIPITGNLPVTVQVSGSGAQLPLMNSRTSVSNSASIANAVYGFSGSSGTVMLLGNPSGTNFNKVDGDSSSKTGYGPFYTDISSLGITASADVSGLAGVNINQMRLMFAQQRLLELNMRAGTRYTEFIQAHFNASPTDARLDRPEYIGGCMIPISVSPLVQTSATGDGTPQGNKSGIANANAVQHIGNYRVLEHGLIMTLINIVPKPIYQQGINRQWLRQTRWDYYFCEFAYLSEQGVYNAELYCDGIAPNGDAKADNDIFGYQAHWNELRCKNNMVTGSVREQFDYWTMARKFGSRPALNQDFIEVEDSDFNRIFAVQDEDEFIISWSNLIDAYRPLPAFGTPGLVDHVYGGR